MSELKCVLSKKQEKALELLSKGLTPRKTSEILGISVRDILKWLEEDEVFIDELSKRVSLGNITEVEFRLRNNQALLEEIYASLYNRVHNLKELEQLDIKTLMQLAVLISNQIRADTHFTGDRNNDININLVLNQVAERAKKATSFSVIDAPKAIEGGNGNDG